MDIGPFWVTVDNSWSSAFPNPSKRADQHRRLCGLFVAEAMDADEQALAVPGGDP
jgi:hypothetical protein